MNKKLFVLGFLLVGLLLVGYGVLAAPVTNEAEIKTHYRCDRITLESLATDVYCDAPASAPEAEKSLGNMFTYSGAAVTVLSAVYLAVARHPKKK